MTEKTEAILNTIMNWIIGAGVTATTSLKVLEAFTLKDYNDVVYALMVTLTCIVAVLKLINSYIYPLGPIFGKKKAEKDKESNGEDE